MTEMKSPAPEQLPSIQEAEQAVLAVCDDWYDLAHAESVNVSDWKKVAARMDKAMQTLRRARAKARGLPHGLPHESNQG